jgi:hypothetical protein
MTAAAIIAHVAHERTADFGTHGDVLVSESAERRVLLDALLRVRRVDLDHPAILLAHHPKPFPDRVGRVPNLCSVGIDGLGHADEEQ